MADTSEHDSAGPATMTAEPPAPPKAPPTTGVAGAPRPKRRRWLAWTIGILVVVAIVGSLAAVVWFARSRPPAAASPDATASAYASAMKKAGVQASFPSAPVELTSVKAVGSHPLDATFTAEELTALFNTFPHPVDVGGQSFSVSSATIGLPGDGTASMAGTISLNGSSYSGSITAPVTFEAGRIATTGAPTVTAEGFDITGARAEQATAALVDYVNGYLSAAPGLKIATAELAGSSVHVTGTAPDSLVLP